MTSWAERDKRVLWHPFTPIAEWEREQPLVVVRGEGNYLVGDDGRRYFDGVSSLWCNVHGHGHPRLTAAIARQASELAHSTLLGLTHPPAIELAEKLVALAPKGLTRVFYSDSGSTAVEIALKQAFQYWAHRGEPKRQRFVRLENAYHGDTLGAVGVGGIELFHRIFGALIVRSLPVPAPFAFPDREGLGPEGLMARSLAVLDQVLREHGGEVAAMVMEPLVQGAAGMLVHPPGFLREVAARCQRHGVLLVVDEVATGFGRTGTMFACEREGVSPDLMCVAKGISGGYLPLAATLATEEVYSAFRAEREELKTFFHGHTYTGNPIACAVGLESLAILEEERVLERVRARAALLRDLLAAEIGALPWVGDVRQVGLMVGIELVKHRATGECFTWNEFRGVQVCNAVRRHGVILRPLGDVIVWMPPLSITEDECRLLARATRLAIEEVCG
jgi:adenosylmethionine---8-amino-7-oxononanoate aminotransferase